MPLHQDEGLRAILAEIYPHRNAYGFLSVPKLAEAMGVARQYLYGCIKEERLAPPVAIHVLVAARRQAKSAKSFQETFDNLLPYLPTE